MTEEEYETMTEAEEAAQIVRDEELRQENYLPPTVSDQSKLMEWLLNTSFPDEIKDKVLPDIQSWAFNLSHEAALTNLDEKELKHFNYLIDDLEMAVIDTMPKKHRIKNEHHVHNAFDHAKLRVNRGKFGFEREKQVQQVRTFVTNPMQQHQTIDQHNNQPGIARRILGRITSPFGGGSFG